MFHTPSSPRPLAAAGILLFALLVLFAGPIHAVPPEAEEPDTEAVEDASDAIAGFRVPDGLEMDLFAAEPLLGNPVSFALDEQGRIYVAETYRFGEGVLDNRGHEYWLLDDLAAEKVEDRLEYYKKWEDKREGGMDYYSQHADQVRRIVDTNDDGKADHSTIFAGGFDAPLDGLAAGVLAYRGNVYLTNIPHLWLLRDTDDDGQAEVRESLQDGFGVRTSLLGHDLHGLIIGPDGKLYFSIGDRGYNVTTPDGRNLRDPMDDGRGAVFRCNLDGSDMEVVHYGLRNPQELAFDQHGNLFTVDNNSDAGDAARLVYIVHGADSGWAMPFQTMEEPYTRGPWNAEKLWDPHFPGQAAWVLPPIDHITSGPSGFTYYPGVGLDDRYDNHFFITDFRGSAGNSGIRSFAVEPSGAGFEMTDAHEYLWKILATDVDFGYDGRMYVSDWIDGWSGTGKGRIYTLHDPDHIDDQPVKETERLFEEGFTDRSADELADLLRHADMRVRLRAQFALAERGGESVETFTDAIASDDQLARLHGVWGLGQISRENPAVLQHVAALLDDDDAVVRGQAAKVLGDEGSDRAAADLTDRLDDDSPRVRFFAALALSQLGHKSAIEPVIEMLRENNDEDVYLRHAGVMALRGAEDVDAVLAYAGDESPAVRMAVLLTLRWAEDPRIARFLHDDNERIVTEAARAINDMPIPEAMPELASLIDSSGGSSSGIDPSNHALIRRVLNANFRLGEPENTRNLARFAADESNEEKMVLEALAALSDWADPSPRDRVLGFYRPLSEQRGPKMARDAVGSVTAELLTHDSDRVRTEATDLAAQYDVAADAAAFLRTVGDDQAVTPTRVAALRLLAGRGDDRLDEAVGSALHSSDPLLRAEARTVLADLDPDRGLASLEQALESGEQIEKQRAFGTLAAMEDDRADELLAVWLDRLIEGDVSSGVQLDLLNAVRDRAEEADVLKPLLARYEGSVSGDDPLAPYRMVLEGGDGERGRSIFRNHAAAQCLRCHKVRGTGGEAGPDLSDLGGRADRRYILESLIQPNAEIAEGFGMTILTLKNGDAVAGAIQSETSEEVRIISPDGSTTAVAADDIADRRSIDTSAMPPMGEILERGELRDLIEYLASLKE